MAAPEWWIWGLIWSRVVRRQEPRTTGSMPLKTCRTYQWPKMEILLSKSPNFNQSILSYLNWLPCSKSFHHILVRITNSCIFLLFRYVCNCYCSLLHRPSFYFCQISHGIFWKLQSDSHQQSVTRIFSLLTSGHRNSGRDQVVNWGKYLWASL